MRIITKGTFFFLSLALAVSLTACSSKETSSSPKILTIGTADSGGTMYPVGKAIAQAITEYDPMIEVNVSASNGSPANVQALMDGEIDLGLVSGDVAFAAANGIKDFEGTPAESLRVIAAVYPSLSNWLVLDTSDLSYVHDLKGKAIGIGPQASTTALSARLALKTMDITDENSVLKNCGLGGGTEELEKKALDAIHGFSGIPINSFAALAEETPCRILRYTEPELTAIIRSNSFYYRDMIPAGTYYGQTEDIPTFGIKCLLCADANMDEDLVYELTSILYKNVSAMKEIHGALAAMEKKSFICSDLPITLHPGAEKFYREQGLLEE